MSSLYKRNKIYWVSYRKHGKSYCKSLKTRDRSLAVLRKNQFDIKLSQTIDMQPASNMLAEDVITRYIDNLTMSTNIRYVKDVSHTILSFLKWAKIKFIKDITQQNIVEYLKYRQEQGKSTRTIHHDLGAIKSMFNWLGKNNLLSLNPAQYISPPKIHRTPPSFLSKEDVRLLLDTAKNFGDIYYMIAISLYTGIRRGELLRMKWEDFNWQKHAILIPKTKTGRFRLIPFNPKLKSLLEPILKKSGDVFKYYDIPKRQWRKIKKITGLKTTWHNLRHTYASHLIQDGKPIKIVSELLGHSQISTTMIYSHLSDAAVAEVGKSVDY